MNASSRLTRLYKRSKSSGTATFLIFDGLDTFANLSFCEQNIGSVNNQFRKWTFDVTSALAKCSKDPAIQVAFYGAPPISAAAQDAAYAAQGQNCIACYGTRFQFEGRQFIRKEQNDYGWDWGPGFSPQGIWKPARLVQVQTASSAFVQDTFVDIYKQGQVNNIPPDQSAPWVLNVSIDYLGTIPKDSLLRATITDRSGATFLQTPLSGIKYETGRITGSTIINKQPKLWWPLGFGTQTLYNITVEVISGSTILLTSQQRSGFRTIVLNQTPISAAQLFQGEASGDNFHFEVNGHTIFAKGSNMVPPDPFWSRVTKADMDILFQSAAVGNHNMIRLWSSSIYMPDFVYDLADEYGILLWSDFQFSDAFYPTDPAFLDNVAKEAAYQVRRINHHPSQALWCGNNENQLALLLILTAATLQYPAALQNFEQYNLDLLIRTVFDNTRSITYLASSSNMGYESFDYNRSRPIVERYAALVPGTVYGDTDYYNYDATKAFKQSSFPIGKFAVEFGFHSHSSYETYKQYFPASQMSFNSSLMIHRNRNYTPDISALASNSLPNPPPRNDTASSINGQGKLSQAAELYYPIPHKQDPATNFSMQIYATQIFHSEFTRTQIEFYRGGSGLRQRTLGSLYWMLNDIWAAPTWASIEKTGRWKMLHYIAADAYSSAIIAPYVDDTLNQLSVAVSNDLWTEARGTASLIWYDWSGNAIGAPAEWSFKNKAITVGAVNSTKVWTNNLLLLPNNLKPAVAVLRTNLTASDGKLLTAERFYVPQSLSTPSTVSAFKDPQLKVTPDSTGNRFTIESKAVAAFVWLDHPIEAKGFFSKNGFWMLPGKQTITFTPYNEVSLPAGWQNKVRVRSVYDLTTP